MKKMLAATAAAVLLLFTFFTVFPQREESGGKVKIGTPDDTGGMIIHYLINEKGFQGAEARDDFEIYPVKDCCSSTSQWALSTGQYNLAVMCPDAAASLIEKDGRFEIAGPCLANSDIVVVKPGLTPRKIGVARNRSHQAQIAADIFGKGCAAVPMLPSALPCAYEKSAVDGVVVDALRGISMEGEKLSAGGATGHVTYVLVVSKRFKEDPRYREFISLFRESVDELNNPDILRKEIGRYKNIELSQEEIETWNRLGIRYIFTTPEM
ncbi:hypothetical membrane protein [Pelotomaculum thermopropionicum SI]|uniref:Hypothetical membrane protein n=1 Tax=Pelotomaculum thermopropionicum (strain DSM 13744 / JCM 10971 / SI) TaxID=370438 RepID=A5D4T1_PELTS|nr:hypothetical membrane protein [Pelotomaculum thermopropionicum SI]